MASYMFGFMGAVLLVMPDHTVNTMVSSKLGGAAGYGIASGLCYILQGATNHDRLKSVTYKRLNIGLLGFSLMSLAAVPGEAGFLPTFVPALLLSLVATIVRLLGAFAAYSGWVQGLGGKASPRTLIQDFAQDTKETLLGLRVKHKGALFRNAFVHLAIGAFEISLHWSAVARLFMISTIIYSLKDAAERDRLQGTTFIQLNVMVGIWAFLVGIGQTVYPLGFAPKRGAIMFAFAVPFILSALVNTRLKSDKASPRIK
ncbi:hypothetical protein MPSEU_000574500 [Mayamaea pseudoterrestris]|nr:hypothetical protein MPSEU_000574500 [Mayamaea pseudoterrestris]